MSKTFYHLVYAAKNTTLETHPATYGAIEHAIKATPEGEELHSLTEQYNMGLITFVEFAEAFTAKFNEAKSTDN